MNLDWIRYLQEKRRYELVLALDRLLLALYRADIERAQRRARKLSKARKGLGILYLEEAPPLSTRKDISWDRDERKYSRRGTRHNMGRKPRTFRDQ